MNKITILAISAVFAVSMIAITTFEVEAIKPTQESASVCPAENVQHWNTFSWDTVQIIRHPTLPSIGGGYLEIQVPTDKNYSDKGFVVARLTELGYLDSQNNPLTTSNIDTATAGSSSMICAEN